MRARYTAHVNGNIAFLRDTLTGEAKRNFDEAAAKKWADDSEWLGLKIVNTEAGGPSDEQGTVEFIARYKLKGNETVIDHHELSSFRKEGGKWFFVAGQMRNKGAPVVRDANKVGRNDPCHCGSGKKFKKCHGA